MREQKLLSVSETAMRLNVRCETILRWIHTGRISAKMLANGYYRIPESELAKVLEPAKVNNDGNTEN